VKSTMMVSGCRSRVLQPLQFGLWIIVALASVVVTCIGGAGIARAADFPSGLMTGAARTEYTYDALTPTSLEALPNGAPTIAYRRGIAPRDTSGQRAQVAIGTSTTRLSRSVATEAVNVIPSSGKTFVGTPRGTVYDVPEGWAHRVADNGKGSVYQRPGATGNQDMIRIMEPTPKYPDGYARVYNGQPPNGQPVDVFGKPGPQPATHVPETYVGPWPAWPT
jgi:hypothetical protein